jgi:hypothetical protein
MLIRCFDPAHGLSGWLLKLSVYFFSFHSSFASVLKVAPNFTNASAVHQNQSPPRLCELQMKCHIELLYITILLVLLSISVARNFKKEKKSVAGASRGSVSQSTVSFAETYSSIMHKELPIRISYIHEYIIFEIKTGRGNIIIHFSDNRNGKKL